MPFAPNITAQVLYRDPDGQLHLRTLPGTAFHSTDPKDWKLGEENSIIAVFDQATYLNAWLEGERKTV